MAATKTKKYPNENSLKNLEKRKCFSKNNAEVAKNAQKKSVAKRRENKMLRQVAEERLNKLYPDGKTFQEKSMDLIEEMIMTGVLKPADLVSLLTFLRDTAGQKPIDSQVVVQSSVTTNLTKNDIKSAIKEINGLVDG